MRVRVRIEAPIQLNQIKRDKISGVTCHVSYVTCHMSSDACHLTHVINANSQSPPPANSPTMHNRMVFKDPKNVEIADHFWTKIVNFETTEPHGQCYLYTKWILILLVGMFFLPLSLSYLSIIAIFSFLCLMNLSSHRIFALFLFMDNERNTFSQQFF